MAKGIGAKNKWEEYARRVDTSTSSKHATFELTLKHTLDLLGDHRDGQVLDIGCGFGEIDILLAKKTNFFITGCDISDVCVRKAQELVRKSDTKGRVKIESGDVYSLAYPNDYFDAATSFGYASAASYKGVQNEVWRVLKPNGLLICDFINALSVYKFPQIVINWRKMREASQKNYDFVTTEGIRVYFGRFNFVLQDQRFFNTYPPLNFMPKEFLLAFEKLTGRFLPRILGRVRIVCFRKVEKR